MTQGTGRDEATLREELGVFGLSDTEVDTYLAVLARGEATTSDVASDAGVTQRAIYDIAERLEQRGLVRVNDHASPTTIRAVPPQQAMTDLSDRLDALTPALEDRFEQTTARTPEIQMVKSRETALRRLRSAISEADHEVAIALPALAFPEIESELRTAADRDVLVFLLLAEVDDPEREVGRVAEVADAVRYWPVQSPFLYCVDQRSSMIGNPDVLSGPHTDNEAVTVSQQHLTGAVHGIYFGAYWPAATEVFVTDPDPLPAAFEWFPYAVFQAALHRQHGTALEADVETAGGESITGRVSQIRQAFVDPPTNEYTLETSLYLDTDAGTVSFGGTGAFIEDHEAVAVTLREAV